MGSWTTKAAAAEQPTKPTKARATRKQKPTNKVLPTSDGSHRGDIEEQGNQFASQILQQATGLPDKINPLLSQVLEKITSVPAKLVAIEETIGLVDRETDRKINALRHDLERFQALIQPPNASFVPEELDVLEKAMLYLSRANWLNPTPRAHASGQETITLTRYERMKSITDKIRQLVKK